MTLTITKVEVIPVADALYPTLRIIASIKNQTNPVNIFSVEGEFFITEGTKEIYVGYIHSNLADTCNLSHNTDVSLPLICSLTFSKLNLIEEIRKGQKLNYKVRLYINCWETNNVKRYLSDGFGVIEKSAWIEDILGTIGYGKVDYLGFRFSELRRDDKIEKELEYFHKAIQAYNEGDYDKVLVECRKVMEGLDTKGKELKISEKAGEENYNRALKESQHFLSLGAHSEDKIKAKVLRRDAEFALSTLLGFLRFISNILKES